ncbi:MAG: TIGR00266 family protein [Thermoplasmata archaeon]
MEYKITGDNLQFVNIELAPGEKVYAEAGTMAYMSGNVTVVAKARGGVWKGIKRKFTGETFFLTEFLAQGGDGVVGFGGNVPGKIVPLDLRGGKTWFLQKDAFLCAEDRVEMDLAWQKRLGGALFGGEGFIIQKVWGDGTVFIHAPGDFVEMNLNVGEMVKVSTGNAVAWEKSVAYDIQTIGGIKTALFGGEGLFVTTLRGPGKVILQSMTLPQLASALVPFLPRQTSGPQGFGIRVGGR